MNRWSLYLAKTLLSGVIHRACPSAVPRSGPEGELVDCFITKVCQGDEPLPVVLAIDGEILRCVAWDGDHYGRDEVLHLSELKFSQFDIVHFYGLSEVRYSGLLDLLIGRLTYWPYLKIHAVLLLSRINQYYFNKKKLITRRRIELLVFLVALHQQGQTRFDAIDLMTRLYSLRWIEHPDRDAAMRQLEFYLEALVETGELDKEDHQYRVTGFALRSIEEDEEYERKHGENVRLQRGMFWLTVAIAAFTAIQAGLVRLPTLLDLTK